MLWFIVCLLSMIITGLIAQSRGRSYLGWVLVGFLFGPLGILAALVAPKNTEALEQKAIQNGDLRKCPSCAEIVRVEAVKCKHCGDGLASV